MMRELHAFGNKMLKKMSAWER